MLFITGLLAGIVLMGAVICGIGCNEHAKEEAKLQKPKYEHAQKNQSCKKGS